MGSPDADYSASRRQTLRETARSLRKPCTKWGLSRDEPTYPVRRPRIESVAPRYSMLEDSSRDSHDLPSGFRAPMPSGQQLAEPKSEPVADKALLKASERTKRTGLLIDKVRNSTNTGKRVRFNDSAKQKDHRTKDTSLYGLFRDSEYAVDRLVNQIDVLKKKSLEEVARLQEQVEVLQGQITDLETERDLQKMQKPQGDDEKMELAEKLDVQELMTLCVQKELERERACRKVAEKKLNEIRELADPQP